MLTNNQRGVTLSIEVGEVPSGSRPNLTFHLLNERRHNVHNSYTYGTF